MRELSYAVTGKIANLRTFAIDSPGHGGACYHYSILDDHPENPHTNLLGDLRFQHGPIQEGNGVNGIQIEDVLAICIDRLRGFQSGKFACDDNAEALTNCEKALECLQRRTKARVARGVEGTHTV